MVNRTGLLLQVLPQVPAKVDAPLLAVAVMNGARSTRFLVSPALKFLIARTLLTLL